MTFLNLFHLSLSHLLVQSLARAAVTAASRSLTLASWRKILRVILSWSRGRYWSGLVSLLQPPSSFFSMVTVSLLPSSRRIRRREKMASAHYGRFRFMLIRATADKGSGVFSKSCLCLCWLGRQEVFTCKCRCSISFH